VFRSPSFDREPTRRDQQKLRTMTDMQLADPVGGRSAERDSGLAPWLAQNEENGRRTDERKADGWLLVIDRQTASRQFCAEPELLMKQQT